MMHRMSEIDETAEVSPYRRCSREEAALSSTGRVDVATVLSIDSDSNLEVSTRRREGRSTGRRGPDAYSYRSVGEDLGGDGWRPG